VNIFGMKTKALVAAMAMVASVGAHATQLSVVSVTGLTNSWVDSGSGVLSSVPADATSAGVALGGNAAAPGGNLQLGAFGRGIGFAHRHWRWSHRDVKQPVTC
jgi:hypothetical protein